MAKISSYPEVTAVDPELYLAMAPTTQNQRYITPIGNANVFPFRNKMNPQTQEFDQYPPAAGYLAGAPKILYPFSGFSISSGVALGAVQEANHPGIWTLKSGALANSGFAILLGSSTVDSILIGGGETAEFIFRLNITANLQAAFGFFDAIWPSSPVDKVELNIQGTTFTGQTLSNSVGSTTSTSYAVTTATWYRGKIVVNSGATLVTFYLYNSATGALLWSDTLSTNIPTAAGRETNFGIKTIKTSATATNIFDIDWMSFYNTKALVR